MRLTYELRLVLDVLQRVKVPRMPRSINQMLGMILRPVSLRRACSMVRYLSPWICATVDEQEVLCRDVEATVTVPCIDIGR
jgi:hypothetical protein